MKRPISEDVLEAALRIAYPEAFGEDIDHLIALNAGKPHDAISAARAERSNAQIAMRRLYRNRFLKTAELLIERTKKTRKRSDP